MEKPSIKHCTEIKEIKTQNTPKENNRSQEPPDRHNAISWVDSPYTSKDRILLAGDTLPVPGLQMIGKHTMHNAVSPLPYHYHENCYEFTYISKGVITFSAEGREYQLSGGDVFLTRPDEIHSTNSAPISVGEIYWFQLNVSELEDFLFLSTGAAKNLTAELKKITQRKIKTDTTEMLSCIRRCLQLCLTGDQFFGAAACLLYFLQRLLEYRQSSQSQLTPDIEQALLYITGHITEPVSLDQLAELCHLSTSQLKQKFKAEIGVSPRNYINFQKIKSAKKLLLSNRSITQTAMDLSFSSSSYFAVVFKRYAACTPTEYLLLHPENRKEN